MRIRRGADGALEPEGRDARPAGPQTQVGGRFTLHLLIGFAACFGVGWLAGEAVHALGGRDGFALDLQLIRLLARNRAPWLTDVMRLITSLGGAAFLSILTVVAAVYLYLRRRWAAGVLLAASAFAGSVALYQAIKALVDRPRPELGALAGFGGSAWPSGHATGAAAVLVALAYLFASRERGPRLAVWAAALGLVLLVGVSRVYLAVHWPSDVIAGFGLGTAWGWICARATGVKGNRGRRSTTAPAPR